MKEGPTFLIVDDDANNRFLTGHALTREFRGCRVIEAATIDEALAKAQETPPDAVITDHHLGNNSGMTFISRLRQTGANCPVIMLTGSVDPAVHERALAAGAKRVFLSFQTEYLKYLRELLPS